MIVGILSMQRVINYGSFLQAFALKSIIESQGNTCVFIDVKPVEGKMYPYLPEKRIIRVVKWIIRSIIRTPYQIWCQKKHERFLYQFYPLLGLPSKPRYEYNCDALIIGSDEVFNCTQDVYWGQSMQLFGEGIDCKTLSSYAASFGYTNISRIEEFHLREKLSCNLKRFSHLSVRDENSKSIIQNIIGVEPQLHLDPALIYPFYGLIPSKQRKDNYIVVYGYNNRINETEIVLQVKEIAEKENLRVLGVGLFQEWCDENIIPTPFELLSYFKYAKYIVTDTFHGTVFSIKFQRPFCVIIRNSNDNKITDLLDRFNLISHKYTVTSSIEKVLHLEINESDLKRKIDEEYHKSVQYIQEIVGGVNAG